jgi:GNAT superfamily N-acetyltransferase
MCISPLPPSSNNAGLHCGAPALTFQSQSPSLQRRTRAPLHAHTATISHPIGKAVHLNLMPSSRAYPKSDHGHMDAKSAPQDSADCAPDETLLDNPIWNALLSDHRTFAVGDGQARRYPSEVGPLSGTPDQSPASYQALHSLAGAGGVLALFFQDPPSHPLGWTLIRGGLLSQMIWRGLNASEIIQPRAEAAPRRLSPADVPEMLALAELTEPGPFRQRTVELGSYYGIFESGRLVAMAGERMSLPGYIEVSAVCTHPDVRGRGFARTLMVTVMRDIRRRGRTPFLHALADNLTAIRVYESLGFTLRRTFHLAVLKNEA